MTTTLCLGALPTVYVIASFLHTHTHHRALGGLTLAVATLAVLALLTLAGFRMSQWFKQAWLTWPALALSVIGLLLMAQRGGLLIPVAAVLVAGAVAMAYVSRLPRISTTTARIFWVLACAIALAVYV